MANTRILCPIDFSESSREAMRAAAALAHRSEATLVLLHVFEPRLWLSSSDMPQEVVRDLRDRIETDLAAWKVEARRLGATEVLGKLVDGIAWDQIAAAANADPSIDVIVVGTHGRTGLHRALIGSVAEKVVRHAPCTVMVVRSRRP